MPWEIDYALLTFTQLKKSKYYLPEDVSITIDSVLNLSSFLINWDESKLPKEFFIEKYNTLSILLKDYTHKLGMNYMDILKCKENVYLLKSIIILAYAPICTLVSICYHI